MEAISHQRFPVSAAAWSLGLSGQARVPLLSGAAGDDGDIREQGGGVGRRLGCPGLGGRGVLSFRGF